MIGKFWPHHESYCFISGMLINNNFLHSRSGSHCIKEIFIVTFACGNEQIKVLKVSVSVILGFSILMSHVDLKVKEPTNQYFLPGGEKRWRKKNGWRTEKAEKGEAEKKNRKEQLKIFRRGPEYPKNENLWKIRIVDYLNLAKRTGTIRKNQKDLPQPKK